MGVEMTTGMARTMAATRWPAALQRVTLGEVGADGFHRSWIMLFPVGEFEHPQYGQLDFTRAKLADIKAMWERRVRHIDVALDVDHKAGQDDSRATGWIERLQLRDASPDGSAPAGLWGQIKWTPYGLRLLRDDEYRYFSPEFGPWTDPANNQHYDDVLMGGALTNRPFLKVMPAIALADTAVSHKPWGSIDKDCLPRSAFLDQGDPNKTSTWRLPVYEGTGPKDADGRYTKRGPLNINGVRAALAALGGARTGTAMTGVPAGVKAKLQGWLAKYGGSASASERGAPARKARAMARAMAKTQALTNDNDIELDEESAQLFADDAETYDDIEEMDDSGADDDSAGPDAEDEANSGEDDNAFDPNADRHGAMTTKSHTHGKYAGHGHANDGSHDGVPMASGKKTASDRKDLMGAKTAVKTTAEPQTGMTTRQLAEMKRLQEELATVRYTLYETQVGKTLDGWKAQTFQFRDSAKGAAKSGRIALTKVFADAYREFMLHDGITLTESRRTKLNELIELALSTAIVDLSERGSSYTQDAPGGGRAPGSGNASDRLQDHAEKLAAAEYAGKQLSELTEPQKMAIYDRAAREVGYK
jgi:hypothetical protein